MENNGNRRLLIAIALVLLFAVVIIVWYFYYAKPIIAPTLTETNNPILSRIIPPRAQFLLWGQDSSSTSTTEVTNPLADPLVRIWDKPAAGQTFTTTDILKEVTSTSTVGTTTVTVKNTVRATSTVILFVDRTTGYIYGYPLGASKPYQISNTLIPGVHDAYFFNNGTRVIMRYVDQDKNRVVGLIANVPRVPVDANALPLENTKYLTSEVMSVAVNTKKDRASYVVATGQGSAIYTITTKDPVFVTSSPFREWDIAYGGDSLFVTTKPSAYVEGATLSIPRFGSELSGKTGLMSTPGDSGIFLNSMWSSRGLATFLSYEGNLKVLSIKTLASKCGWGGQGFLICAVPRIIIKGPEGLPDDWFQGRSTYADDLVVVDKNTGDNYNLYTFSQKEGEFDIKGVTVTQENDLIVFNKKQDGTLWLLNTNLLRDE